MWVQSFAMQMQLQKPKIDLSAATFMIPVRIESADRLRNVITTVSYLLTNFDTTVIVKEVDSTSVFEDKALPEIKKHCGDVRNLVHQFVCSSEPSFHRQYILNDMILHSKTEIVVNYDCDVLLDPGTVVNAYQKILQKQYDVIYPYGFGQYLFQVDADDKLVSEFLLGCRRGTSPEFSILKDRSTPFQAEYGFVQFFNRQVYIDGGLENENFVSYGPEDYERHHRFHTLGYKVGRIDDWVYHLEHTRGPNSSCKNPHNRKNRAEWNKIKRMDKASLREYLSSQEYYKSRLQTVL